ncbi:MAG: LptE family protein [Elusimicrobia bacterium]|nr:LptE family protein [Elusimicrobiota bacterium]
MRKSGMLEVKSGKQGLKWKKNVYFLFLISYFFILLGCSSPYKPAPQSLPQNIKKVTIETFKNSTVFFGIEDKLTTAVTNEFMRDGRLALSNLTEADGILRGEITRYIMEPLTYDENHVVKEYKLRILLNISLIDKTKNEIVWQENNIEGNYRFFISPNIGGITEEEAREIIWEKLSRDIIKRTIKGFGSVTGISDKKVPPPAE